MDTKSLRTQALDAVVGLASIALVAVPWVLALRFVPDVALGRFADRIGSPVFWSLVTVALAITVGVMIIINRWLTRRLKASDKVG